MLRSLRYKLSAWGAFLTLALLLGSPGSAWTQDGPYLQSRLKKALLLSFNNNHGPTTQASMDLLAQIGKEKGFAVDVVTTGDKFNATDLAEYQVVLFVQNRTFGLTETQKTAFENWYKKGNGALCMHACTLDQYWSFYQSALGAMLAPHSDVIETEVTVAAKTHPIMKDYNGEKLSWDDEWFYWITAPTNSKEVTILLTVDFASLPPQTYPVPVKAVYPNAWVKNSNGGRFLTWGGTHTTTAKTKYADFSYNFLFNGLKYIAGTDTVKVCTNPNMCTNLAGTGVAPDARSKEISRYFGSDLDITYSAVKIMDVRGKTVFQGNHVNPYHNGAFRISKPGLYFVMTKMDKKSPIQKRLIVIK